MTDAHLQQFIESLERSLAGGRFVKLTLAKHRGAESDLRNVYVRLVEIKSGVAADEVVATSNVDQLSDGVTVRQ